MLCIYGFLFKNVCVQYVIVNNALRQHQGPKQYNLVLTSVHPNLLGTKRLGCCCCCNISAQLLIVLCCGMTYRNTGEFMMSRYREVADIVLDYLRHRDPLVRRSITSLLPRIAHFLRDRFVTNYLKVVLSTTIFCNSDVLISFALMYFLSFVPDSVLL
jgi:hypothetical protein